jgi:hypothetical protein
MESVIPRERGGAKQGGRSMPIDRMRSTSPLLRCPLVALLTLGACEAIDPIDEGEPAATLVPTGERPVAGEEVLARAVDLSEAAPEDAAEALTCGKPIAYSTVWGHGGSLFERYDVYTFGSSQCHACFERSHASVSHSGNGDCAFLGWVSTTPTDCRISVGVRTSGGGANGTCNIRIYEQLVE